MRLTILAAASALVLAACSPAEPAKEEAAAPAAPAPAAAPAHDMAAMDGAMKTSDAGDDAATGLTPEGYTFHTAPSKVESVHLPAAGDGAWGITASDPGLVAITSGKDEKMPDGTTHFVARLTPKASGNATVRFDRRASAGSAGPILETRTVQFMVH